MSTIQCPKCKGSGVVPDPKAKGAELMRARKAAGVTLQEIASILELSIGYISDLEHGRKRWTHRRINFYLAAAETAKQERESAPL